MLDVLAVENQSASALQCGQAATHEQVAGLISLRVVSCQCSRKRVMKRGITESLGMVSHLAPRLKQVVKH